MYRLFLGIAIGIAITLFTAGMLLNRDQGTVLRVGASKALNIVKAYSKTRQWVNKNFKIKNNPNTSVKLIWNPYKNTYIWQVDIIDRIEKCCQSFEPAAISARVSPNTGKIVQITFEPAKPIRPQSSCQSRCHEVLKTK
jgi:hypothetical protein